MFLTSEARQVYNLKLNWKMKLKFFTLAALIGAGSLSQGGGVAAFDTQPVDYSSVLAEVEMSTQLD